VTIKRFDPSAYRGPLLNFPEGQLVRFIIHEAGTLYTFFNFVVEPAIGPPPRRGWDYLFCTEIPRRDLGLRPGQPGDIDVLIIPKFNGEPRVEFAAAIEVKRLALRGPNWSKNVDRYGITQASGLLRCGFPFVGILHLIVNADGPEDNWRPVMHARVLDEEGHVEFTGDGIFDFTGCEAADRQFARLLSQGPDPVIGLNSVAVSLGEREGELSFGTSEAPTRFASRNPKTHPHTLRNPQTFAGHMAPLAHLRNADARR